MSHLALSVRALYLLPQGSDIAYSDQTCTVDEGSILRAAAKLGKSRSWQNHLAEYKAQLR